MAFFWKNLVFYYLLFMSKFMLYGSIKSDGTSPVKEEYVVWNICQTLLIKMTSEQLWSVSIFQAVPSNTT